MHHFFRNRFLGSASFLPAVAGGEGDGGGGASGEGQQDPAASGGAAAGDDNGQQDGAQGDDGGAEGGDDNGDDGSQDDGGDSPPQDDNEDDLAGLSAEQRAKVEARIARETGWRDRQINKLYGKTRQQQSDLEAMQTIADPQRRGQQAPAGDQQRGGDQQRFTQEDVRREAQRMTAQERYDQACNDADAAGRNAYKGDWEKRLGQLPKLGGVSPDDMVNVVATDKPHVVLYHLADPETYERVMALPPAKRHTEFVKLSLLEEPKPAKEIKEDKRPGQGQPSGQQVQGRRTSAQSTNLYADNVEDAKWYEERNRTRRKKFSNAE